MKILIVGATGRMGSAVAWDLARDPSVDKLGLLGRSPESMEKTRAWIGGGPNICCHAIDVLDPGIVPLLGEYDAAVLTLPDRLSSYRCVEAAIEAGTHAVDILEEYHRTPDRSEQEGLVVPEGVSLLQYGELLHERALQRGVTILDGMGFAPGISNITVGRGITMLDTATSAVARVGGIPDKDAAAHHPLRYVVTWSLEHVLREYSVRVPVRRAGQLAERNAGDEREAFVFSALGRSERLECAITPGMPSILSSRPQLLDFTEKTVRWPGHWQGIATLKECGLLDLEPVDVEGQRVVPRQLLLALLGPRLRPRTGEHDVCVMLNTIEGTKNGRPAKVEYHLWDEGQPELGLSAMMRITGFPAALGARLLAQGVIQQRGIIPPEDAITGEVYEWFLRELAARQIHIVETFTELPTAPTC